MAWQDQIVLFLVSFAANSLSALAGGGAGLLQLPALLILGLPFATALATHKVASVALGLGASIRHFRGGPLDRSLLLVLCLGGVPGVVLGTMGILQVPEAWARLALGILTAGLGIYSIARPNLGLHPAPRHRDLPGLLQGAACLFLIGMINGSLTSGSGLFVTLWLVTWFGLDYARAVAYTLIVVGLLWNGTGALSLGLQTHIQWDWMPALLLGSLLGGYAGAHWSQVQGSGLVKRVFEGITLLVGVKLMYDGALLLMN